MSEPAPGIGQERRDGSTSCGPMQSLDPLGGGEVGLERVHLDRSLAQFAADVMNGGLVSGDEKIELVCCAALRELESIPEEAPVTIASG